MQVIKAKQAVILFDEQLYQTSPLFITSDEYWDGGISADSTLKEKVKFYSLAERMSNIVKEIVLSLGETPIIGKPFCEFGKVYEHWSNLGDYELFREISRTIKETKCYRLSFPEDNNIIDLIIESNFRYFTNVSLYLPLANIIIRPSCHTEVLVYSRNSKEILPTLQAVVDKWSDMQHCISVKVATDT